MQQLQAPAAALVAALEAAVTACTCAPCGREFAGLTAFDKHQDANYKRTPAVICQDPASLGMILNPHGRWGFPLNESGRKFFESLKDGADAG